MTDIAPPRLRHHLPGGHRPYNPSTIIAQRMLRKGVRLTHVARTSGVHERLLSDYLARRKKPSRRSQALISRYFGITPNDFLDKDGFFALAPGFETTEDTPR